MSPSPLPSIEAVNLRIGLLGLLLTKLYSCSSSHNLDSYYIELLYQLSWHVVLYITACGRSSMTTTPQSLSLTSGMSTSGVFPWTATVYTWSLNPTNQVESWQLACSGILASPGSVLTGNDQHRIFLFSSFRCFLDLTTVLRKTKVLWRYEYWLIIFAL